MSSAPTFRVRYWGVTGTLARTMRPGDITDKLAAAVEHLLDEQILASLERDRADPAAIRRTLEAALPFHLRSSYLGNSTCIEIETPGELIVVDCGSGFRDLGYDLERRWGDPNYSGPRRVDVVFTHPHVDHLMAFPFVESFYNPRNHFAVWAPRTVLDSLDAVFGEHSPTARVFAPTGYVDMAGIKEFHEVRAGEAFTLGETRVSVYPLHHPGGCVAYRFDRGGRSVVIATDHEHQEVPDRRLAEFARGVDLLYADAQYRTEEYTGQAGIGGSAPLSHVGWGHSTIDAVVATAVHADVRTLHLGHHEPHRTDLELHHIEQLAARLLADQLAAAGKPPAACRTQLAYEGLTLEV